MDNMDNIDVLIVDDSALMRNLVSRMLESASGITVCTKAMNGQMALEKFLAIIPTLLFWILKCR